MDNWLIVVTPAATGLIGAVIGTIGSGVVNRERHSQRIERLANVYEKIESDPELRSHMSRIILKDMLLYRIEAEHKTYSLAADFMAVIAGISSVGVIVSLSAFPHLLGYFISPAILGAVTSFWYRRQAKKAALNEGERLKKELHATELSPPPGKGNNETP